MGLLEQQLSGHGLRTFFLHGSLGVRRRQRAGRPLPGRRGRRLRDLPQAGGTGLNLTRASHVVHYDRWWNPAVEDQASDRAWRLGQDKPVTVHRLICGARSRTASPPCSNPKRALADVVVGSGEGWISELDDAALADLVRLSVAGDTGLAANRRKSR